MPELSITIQKAALVHRLVIDQWYSWYATLFKLEQREGGRFGCIFKRKAMGAPWEVLGKSTTSCGSSPSKWGTFCSLRGILGS